MSTVLFALPGNEELTDAVSQRLNAERGLCTIRHFPDGESYIRIHSNVKGKCVVLVSTLCEPDEKLLPLYFLSQTATSLGAKCTCLVAPYLAYMRQDKVFNPGEGVTSEYFAKLVSTFADSLVTVDPHLHRKSSLSEIYSIPCLTIHAANHISAWIKSNVCNPVLVGPDAESEQWVSKVARAAASPYTVLEKIRLGDREVEISFPQLEEYREHTPVLVDDIISTATTMIKTVELLNKSGMKPPVCIGVHAVFAGNAYNNLLNAGVGDIVTCNTIPHPSNKIDLSGIIAQSLKAAITLL